MIGFPIVGKIERWKTLISGTHPVGHRRLSQAELVPFGPSTLPSPSTSARTIIRICIHNRLWHRASITAPKRGYRVGAVVPPLASLCHAARGDS